MRVGAADGVRWLTGGGDDRDKGVRRGEPREGYVPCIHRGGVSGQRIETIGDQMIQARLRSEEHTSELQSRLHLVCRLLLEKKKKIKKPRPHQTYDSHLR